LSKSHHFWADWEAKDIVQVSTSLSDVTLLLQARCRPDCRLDCRPRRPCRPCYASSSLYSSIMPRIHQIRRHSAASTISLASRLRFGEISSFAPLKTRSHSADIAWQHSRSRAYCQTSSTKIPRSGNSSPINGGLMTSSITNSILHCI